MFGVEMPNEPPAKKVFSPTRLAPDLRHNRELSLETGAEEESWPYWNPFAAQNRALVVPEPRKKQVRVRFFWIHWGTG